MEDIVYNLLNWQSADLTILACAGIIYQLFSRISPLPRILHTWQKQPFIMEHLNTTWNLRNSWSCSESDITILLCLSPHLSSALGLAENGAESQMLIWFQSNICVFNVEHLPSDKLILALIQFYISGEGREEEGTQYHLDKPHQFSSPITAPKYRGSDCLGFLLFASWVWKGLVKLSIYNDGILCPPLLYLIIVFWALIRSKFVLITNCHSHTSLLWKIKR